MKGEGVISLFKEIVERKIDTKTFSLKAGKQTLEGSVFNTPRPLSSHSIYTSPFAGGEYADSNLGTISVSEDSESYSIDFSDGNYGNMDWKGRTIVFSKSEELQMWYVYVKPIERYSNEVEHSNTPPVLDSGDSGDLNTGTRFELAKAPLYEDLIVPANIFILAIIRIPSNSNGYKFDYDPNSTMAQIVFGYQASFLYYILKLYKDTQDSLLDLEGGRIAGQLVVNGDLVVTSADEAVQLTPQGLSIYDVTYLSQIGLWSHSDKTLLANFNKDGVFFYDNDGIILSHYGRDGAHVAGWGIKPGILEAENIQIRSDGSIQTKDFAEEEPDTWKLGSDGSAWFNNITARGTGDIAGWKIDEDKLRNEANTVILNSEKARLEIKSSPTGAIKVAAGYLDGVGGLEANDYGIYLGAANTLYIEADEEGADVVQHTGGNWLVKSDANILLKDGDLTLLRIGNESAVMGMFLYSGLPVVADNVNVSVEVDTSGTEAEYSFNSSGAFEEILVADDIIVTSQFTNDENNGRFRVISATDSKIVVDAVLVPESAGKPRTILKHVKLADYTAEGMQLRMPGTDMKIGKKVSGDNHGIFMNSENYWYTDGLFKVGDDTQWMKYNEDGLVFSGGVIKWTNLDDDSKHNISGYEIRFDKAAGSVYYDGTSVSPSSIDFTASFIRKHDGVAIPIGSLTSVAWTFEVQNGASFTGATDGLSATVNTSSATGPVLIRCTIEYGGRTYTNEIGISYSEKGEEGDPGADGQSVDMIFRRSETQPATPSPSAGVPSNWYTDVNSVPAGDGWIWSSVGTRETPTSNWVWQTPIKIEGSDGAAGEPGEDGLTIVEVFTFRRASSQPSTPTGGTYNFSTNTLTPPSGWYTSPPNGTDPCWISVAFVSTDDPTSTESVSGWSTPTKAFEDGEKGDPGDDGPTIALGLDKTNSKVTWTGGSSYTPSSISVTVSVYENGSLSTLGGAPKTFVLSNTEYGITQTRSNITGSSTSFTLYSTDLNKIRDNREMGDITTAIFDITMTVSSDDYNVRTSKVFSIIFVNSAFKWLEKWEGYTTINDNSVATGMLFVGSATGSHITGVYMDERGLTGIKNAPQGSDPFHANQDQHRAFMLKNDGTFKIAGFGFDENKITIQRSGEDFISMGLNVFPSNVKNTDGIFVGRIGTTHYRDALYDRSTATTSVRTGIEFITKTTPLRGVRCKLSTYAEGATQAHLLAGDRTTILKTVDITGLTAGDWFTLSYPLSTSTTYYVGVDGTNYNRSYTPSPSTYGSTTHVQMNGGLYSSSTSSNWSYISDIQAIVDDERYLRFDENEFRIKADLALAAGDNKIIFEDAGIYMRDIAIDSEEGAMNRRLIVQCADNDSVNNRLLTIGRHVYSAGHTSGYLDVGSTLIGGSYGRTYLRILASRSSEHIEDNYIMLTGRVSRNTGGTVAYNLQILYLRPDKYDTSSNVWDFSNVVEAYKFRISNSVEFRGSAGLSPSPTQTGSVEFYTREAGAYAGVRLLVPANKGAANLPTGTVLVQGNDLFFKRSDGSWRWVYNGSGEPD